MFAQRVLEQIDLYKSVLSNFDRDALDDFFEEVIFTAEKLYDDAIVRAKSAQEEYSRLKLEANDLKKKKVSNDPENEYKAANEEFERISAAIVFAQMDIDKNNKSIERAETEISTLEQKIAAEKKLFWKSHSEEKGKIESATKRIDKKKKDNEKLKKSILKLKDELVIAEKVLFDAKCIADEYNSAESSKREHIGNISEALKALEDVILECNTETVLQDINDSDIFTNELLKVRSSEVNAAVLGKNKKFVDLQRVLSLIESTPFSSEDIKHLGISDEYSAPCQKFYENLLHWSCHGFVRKDTMAFDYVTAKNFKYSNELFSIIENLGSINTPELIDADKDNDDLDEDELLLGKAISVFINEESVTVDTLHRKLKIGRNQAIRAIEQLVERGALSPYNGNYPRKVLVTPEQAIKMFPGINPKELNKSKTHIEVPQISIASKEVIVAKCIYDASFWILSIDFLNKIKEVIESKPNIDLPDLALELLKITKTNGLEKYVLKFKELYNATPDQIMVANQRYFLEKQLEEQEIERKENEIDAMIRCQNCLHYENCRTVGSVGCGSYFPL